MEPRVGEPRRHPARDLVVALAVGVAYFAAARLGLALTFVNASASPVWPPTGLAIAATLVLGLRALPGVFAGAFAANLLVAGHVAASFAIAAGNTGEAAIAALLVRRYADGSRAFESARGTFRFALLAGGVATLLSATVGVASLVAAGLAPSAAAPTVWLTWWLGDAAGAIVVAPALVLWAQDPRPRYRTRRAAELAAVGLAALLAGLLAFWDAAPFLPTAAWWFAALPPVVWVGYRFAPREAATLALALSALAVSGTLRAAEVLDPAATNALLLLLQAFIATATLVAIPLAAVSRARRVAELELARAHDELEQRVVERTRELQQSHQRFETFMRNIPAFAWIKDAEGRYVFANPAFADTVGSAPAELAGRTDADVFPAKTAEEYRANDEKVRETREVVSVLEPQIVRGDLRHSMVKKFPLAGGEATEGYVGGIAVDITDRIRAEQRLQQAQRIGRLGSFEWDLARGVVVWSDELSRICGLAAERRETSADELLAALHPDDRATLANAVRSMRSRAGAFSVRVRIVRPDGAVRIVDAIGEAGAAEGGVVARVMATCQDVTERAEAEAEMRRGSVARKLARRMLVDLSSGSGTAARRRELGRALAAEVGAKDVEGGIEAFIDMGVGRLEVVRSDTGRYVFRGEDLLERSAGAPAPTCYLTLGYLEALVELSIEGPALGSETACQSRGQPTCSFEVRARPRKAEKE